MSASPFLHGLSRRPIAALCLEVSHCGRLLQRAEAGARGVYAGLPLAGDAGRPQGVCSGGPSPPQ